MRKNNSSGPCVYFALFMVLPGRNLEQAVEHVGLCGACRSMIELLAAVFRENVESIISALTCGGCSGCEKKETIQ